MKYKGFTLIEIIIVLLIIIIVASFTMPYYKSFQEKSMLTIAKTMLLSYVQELKSFELKYGYLPDNDDEYKSFEKQMKLNPNNDDNNNKYYKVIYNKQQNLLVTIPQKEKNNFKSCIIMDINDAKMKKCNLCENPEIQQQCKSFN